VERELLQGIAARRNRAHTGVLKCFTWEDSGSTSCLYSPECVEFMEFSEVRHTLATIINDKYMLHGVYTSRAPVSILLLL
jgi:hypothetical protein